jgi:hypothetical protein
MSETPKTVAELLAVNGPLFQQIDKMITDDAVSFATRRERGASASMNGALDYTTLAVCKAICDAAGEEQIWAPMP